MLQVKRMRRVGVTANSRLTVGSQVTGSPQVVAEMAAPPEFRTTNGHRSKSCNQSADGSMATVARKADRQMQSKPEITYGGENLPAAARNLIAPFPVSPSGGKPGRAGSPHAGQHAARPAKSAGTHRAPGSPHKRAAAPLCIPCERRSAELASSGITRPWKVY
jgi:hypothetical protein